VRKRSATRPPAPSVAPAAVGRPVFSWYSGARRIRAAQRHNRRVVDAGARRSCRSCRRRTRSRASRSGSSAIGTTPVPAGPARPGGRAAGPASCRARCRRPATPVSASTRSRTRAGRRKRRPTGRRRFVLRRIRRFAASAWWDPLPSLGVYQAGAVPGARPSPASPPARTPMSLIIYACAFATRSACCGPPRKPAFPTPTSRCPLRIRDQAPGLSRDQPQRNDPRDRRRRLALFESLGNHPLSFTQIRQACGRKTSGARASPSSGRCGRQRGRGRAGGLRRKRNFLIGSTSSLTGPGRSTACRKPTRCRWPPTRSMRRRHQGRADIYKLRVISNDDKANPTESHDSVRKLIDRDGGQVPPGLLLLGRPAPCLVHQRENALMLVGNAAERPSRPRACRTCSAPAPRRISPAPPQASSWPSGASKSIA